MENSEDTKKNRSKWIKFNIPARYVITAMGFYTTLNLYIIRNNINIAMVEMAKAPSVKGMLPGENVSSESYGSVCTELMPRDKNSTPKIKVGEGDFDWDGPTQGSAMGAFFYGNIITPVPLSVMATRLHAVKWTLGLGFLISGILNMLAPVLSHLHVGALIASRAIIGLLCGIVLPGIHCLIGSWIPKSERSRLSTLIFVGMPLGTIATYAVSGVLIASNFLGGWPSVFYVSGLSIVVWFILLVLLVYETPMEHPRITKEELEYISDEQDHKPELSVDSIPWKAILTSRYVWALSLAHFCNNWGFYTVLSQMPTYLANVLFFSILEDGLLSSLPYVAAIIFSVCASFIADWLRKKSYFEITTIRKIMSSVAYFLPAFCLFLIPLMGCRPAAIVALLTLSMGFNSFKYCGWLVTHVEMSPTFAGVLIAFTGSIGNTAGFLAPIFAGWSIKTGHTLENWRIVFITSGIILTIGGLTYILFCTCKPQPWGAVEIEHQDSAADAKEKDEKLDSVEKTEDEA